MSANQDYNWFTRLAEARLVEEPSCDQVSEVLSISTFQQSFVTAANQTPRNCDSTTTNKTGPFRDC